MEIKAITMTTIIFQTSTPSKLVGVQLLMRSCSFLNSLQRITSPNYDPSLDDMSRIPIESQGVRTILIPRRSARKRRYYRFIDTVYSENEQSRWIHISADIFLVVYIVDTAAYDVTRSGNGSVNGVMKDLIFF